MLPCRHQPGCCEVPRGKFMLRAPNYTITCARSRSNSRFMLSISIYPDINWNFALAARNSLLEQRFAGPCQNEPSKPREDHKGTAGRPSPRLGNCEVVLVCRHPPAFWRGHISLCLQRQLTQLCLFCVSLLTEVPC